jgi:hypothetical protein
MNSRTIERLNFVAFNKPAVLVIGSASYVGLVPNAVSDVCLRAKPDHQRIRNRVRGIGRSDPGDVNEVACRAALQTPEYNAGASL